MPIGPFGEVVGTTGTLENVSDSAAQKYKTKVIAPRNPKLLKGEQAMFKVGNKKYFIAIIGIYVQCKNKSRKYTKCDLMVSFDFLSCR